MKTLQIDVQDDLINIFGIKAIKQFIEQELAYQKFYLLEKEIHSYLNSSVKVDWLNEFEIARDTAFNEYKKLYDRPL